MIDTQKQKIPKNHKSNCQCFICKGIRGERVCTSETREKLRITSTGRTNKGRIGQKCSKEHKQKVSLALKGNKNSLGVKRVFSAEHKAKLSAGRMGENNPYYKDGETLKTSTWATKVKERDNYTCQICGKNKEDVGNKKIHAHHIKPKKSHPEFKYDTKYGITLCNICHKKYENKPTKLLKARCI